MKIEKLASQQSLLLSPDMPEYLSTKDLVSPSTPKIFAANVSTQANSNPISPVDF